MIRFDGCQNGQNRQNGQNVKQRSKRVDLHPRALRLTALTLAAALTPLLSTIASPVFGASAVPISFHRDVTTLAGIEVPGEENPFHSDDVRSDLGGIFEEEAVSHLESGNNFASSFGRQASNIQPGFVQAIGAFSGEAGIAYPVEFAEALGSSRMFYDFRIDEPTPYSLVGTLEAVESGQMNFIFRHTTSTILIYHSFREETRYLDEQGVLEPGHYTMEIAALGFGQAFDGEVTRASGNYDVMMTFGETTDVPVQTASSSDLTVFPNPMTSRTTIALASTLADSATEVEIIDAQGRIVRGLGSSEAGSLVWDGRSNQGNRVAPGVYFVRVGRTVGGRTIVLN